MKKYLIKVQIILTSLFIAPTICFGQYQLPSGMEEHWGTPSFYESIYFIFFAETRLLVFCVTFFISLFILIFFLKKNRFANQNKKLYWLVLILLALLLSFVLSAAYILLPLLFNIL